MEWPKLKNIIILILLLANLFLGMMVLTQDFGSTQYQDETLANTISVLERNGIRLERSKIPQELELTPMVVERERETEDRLAAALLKDYTVLELGSGRYSYQGHGGTAEFRSNGSFSFQFEEGAQRVNQIGEEEPHAWKIIQNVGFTGEIESSEKIGDMVTLVLRQTWQGLPVYSCKITMKYESGSLRSIVGQRLMGEPKDGNDKAETISVPTALLRILNGMNGLGDICNEITGMEPGYILETSSEETRMIPVWYVTTDTGAYTLNALTGVLERA